MLGFLHHKANADGSSETKAAGAGGDKHHLMIWLTVGVLVVAFLTYRKMAAGASSATPTIGSAGNTVTSSGDGGDGIGGQAGYFNQQIASLQSQLTDSQAQNATDLANLDSQFTTALAGETAADDASQSAWQARLSGLTDSWANISNTVANIGATTQQTATTVSGISQSQTSGQPGLSEQLRNQLASNGEKVTDVVQSTTGGMLYLTSKGGVYADNGANYFGSYLGYANTTANPGAEEAGHGDFSQGHIEALAGGNYEIFNNKGEGYTFNGDTKAKGY